MIERDAFLYMDPKGKKDKFAQCESCMMWTGPMGNTCTIHGQQRVTKDMTCGLYVHGKNHTDMIGKEMASVKPRESGLMKAKVRCENCENFNPKNGKCMLFAELNEEDDKQWDLDVHVAPKGCCNAWQEVKNKNMASIDELRSHRNTLAMEEEY